MFSHLNGRTHKLFLFAAILFSVLISWSSGVRRNSGSSYRIKFRGGNRNDELVGSDEEPQGHPYPIQIYKQSRMCPDETNDWGPPYRYYRPTKKCYLVGQRGPCGELMTFTARNDDYGYCDCDQSLRCGRPLVYWPQTKRCYFVNDQGPCTPGKWLVFGYNSRPICRKNICIGEQFTIPSRGTQFWFEHKGKCYRTGTQGYCSNKHQVLVNDWDQYRPGCSENEVPNCGPEEPVHIIKCLPGMKMDYYEQCMKTLASSSLKKKNKKRGPNSGQESEEESAEAAEEERERERKRKPPGPNIYDLKLE